MTRTTFGRDFRRDHESAARLQIQDDVAKVCGYHLGPFGNLNLM